MCWTRKFGLWWQRKFAATLAWRLGIADYPRLVR
jgi:hypothetical protein